MYKEQISLDWLAFESYEELSNNLKTRSRKTGIDNNNGKLMTAWLMVLDSLDAQEAQAILRIIHRKGIEGVISACMKTDTTNKNNITNNVERALLELPPEEQDRLIGLTRS
ncbi:MAG: hypothetical protein ACR5LG_13970 [Sodalis sp. (in: enterobacteria)]|uniref:hypothetical protein n=1 Tax=Sodalis sp. (in: enterobacteria) TaxID=1898979 RepID=UPI003F34ADF1